MTYSTRRHPRTLEEAFGPNPWPISGPYYPRRGRGMWRSVVVGTLATIGGLVLLASALAMVVR